MRRSLLVSLVLLSLGVATLPAAASPQTSPVCGPCGESFERAMPDYVGEIEIVHSTATVRFHENGSATWLVRNRLANESMADDLADDPEMFRRHAREAATWGVAEGPFEAFSATVEGDVVYLTFRDPDAATRHPGGVLLTDYLYAGEYDLWRVVNADRFSLVGPAGTEVTNDPAEATVEGANATWYGDPMATQGGYGEIPDDVFVAFDEPTDGVAFWTHLAVARATLPAFLYGVAYYHSLPMLCFALFLAVVGHDAGPLGGSPYEPTTGERRVVAAAVGLLGLGSLLTRSAEILRWFTGGPLTGTGIADRLTVAGFGVVAVTVAVVVLLRDDDATVRQLVATAGAALLAFVLAVAFLLRMPAGVHPDDPVRLALSAGAKLVPVVVAPLFGGALSGGRRGRLLAGLLLCGGFFLTELSLLWPMERPWPIVIFVLLFVAVVVAVATLPFVLLGSVVAEST